MNDPEYKEYTESLAGETYQIRQVIVTKRVIGTVETRYTQEEMNSISNFIYNRIKFVADIGSKYDEKDLKRHIEDLHKNRPYIIDFQSYLDLFLDDLKNNFEEYKTLRMQPEDWEERKKLIEIVRTTTYYDTSTRLPSILMWTDSGTTLKYVDRMSNEELKEYLRSC